ncbi:hypothetical protein HQQ94_14805 [Shewanella sp. VB17]|uniref:hypothetical protein n=1 Tax=Shewanella sp. VB17 TaxID=2739432 RepID=UPI00156325B1|nr:hypothetical protein [Shewanella sp. VB17]NRD74482.1 hypothetical protein [Shewanella sp. VB17]
MNDFEKLIISLVILASLVMVVLFFSPSVIEQRIKPENLPHQAQWVGGIDGGDWIDCQNIDDSTISCSIYTENSGELIEKSLFKGALEGNGLQIDFYDGSKIVTLNGVILNKIDNLK